MRTYKHCLEPMCLFSLNFVLIISNTVMYELCTKFTSNDIKSLVFTDRRFVGNVMGSTDVYL